MEWISTKDKTKIPLEGEHILLTDGKEVFEGLIGLFDDGESVWCDTEYMDNRNHDITHWMPLPNPPEI